MVDTVTSSFAVLVLDWNSVFLASSWSEIHGPLYLGEPIGDMVESSVLLTRLVLLGYFRLRVHYLSVVRDRLFLESNHEWFD